MGILTVLQREYRYYKNILPSEPASPGARFPYKNFVVNSEKHKPLSLLKGATQPINEHSLQEGFNPVFSRQGNYLLY